MSTEEQIAIALRGRAAQRPFIDDLVGTWDALAGTFHDLIAAAEDVARAAAVARVTDDEHAAAFADLRRFLDGRADWRERAARQAGLLEQCAQDVRVLHTRVHRETVNVGVIGVTGAGKSTLLRKLSGLGLDHIPSNKYASSTATPSRIFHDPAAEHGRAVLRLHTWDSFREEVLVPLHQRARLAEPAPPSVEGFRRFDYDGARVPEGQSGAERYLLRLRTAHDSLGSYQGLLRGGEVEITLDRLRAFVAYPPDEKALNRPYHAVRSVDILCRFPEVGAVNLGLVDLPGSGEAGLDVHGRFLTSLRNETDLLFIVKRPSKAPGTEQDWDAKQLADDAGAGVRLQDFAYQVINRDADLPGEYYQEGLARARREGAGLAGEILECDIERTPSAGVTTAILMPVLRHLAARLADMEHAAIMFVLTGLADVASGVRSLADELTGQVDGWQRALPDEAVRHRDRVWALRNEIGARLRDVVRTYDGLYESGEPIAELHEEIARAAAAIREWAADGLGEKSTEEWLATYDKALATHEGHERDRRYNNARKAIVDQFSTIDASLLLAIQRLWAEVAASLRDKLTDRIIPVSSDSRAVLRAFADTAAEDGARTLCEATERLLNLQADYGKIFLRVGRPIVRKVNWQDEETSAGAAVGAAVAGAAVVSSALLAGQAADLPWWEDADGERIASAVADAASSVVGTVVSGLTDPAAKKYPEAAKWHERITATIENVTSELVREFEREAQRTLTILAAAVDNYRDTMTTTKGTEVEYERVTNRAQREIWPEDFADDVAEVT
ncbi:MAG TPA: hypothetical protein VKU39_22055, partial [Streptosporangiaceae bacterium]|nr:hypothetical protein [Streptosporangiaceae bacterium]